MKKWLVALALVGLYTSPIGFVALTGCGSGGEAETIESDGWTEEDEKKKAMEMKAEMEKHFKQQQADMQKGGGGGGIPDMPTSGGGKK